MAANTIAYFTPLDVTWSILSSAVALGPNEGNLTVLKCVLEGTEPAILKKRVEDVLNLLSDPDVVESRNKRRQSAILSICQVLHNSVPAKVSEEGLACKLFRVVITTWAQAQDAETAQKARSK